MNVVRGNVVLVDLSGAQKHETQNSDGGSFRPCVVVQNNRGNEAAHHTIIAPITDREKTLPTHVFITADDQAGKGKDSIIQCEQLRTIDESRVKEVFGILSSQRMAEVDAALKISLAL